MRRPWAEGRFSFHWNDGSTTIIDALTVAGLGERKLYVQNQMRRLSANPKDTRDTPGAYCRTPEYKFGLRKDESGGRYLLLYYEKNDEDEDDRFNYWYQRHVKNATYYRGRSLSQRMLDPTFVLKSIENFKQNDEDLVKIEYTCETAYNIEAGHVVLKPSINWAIRNVDMIVTTKGWGPTLFKENVAYRQIADGRFFPSHMEINEHNPEHTEIYERTLVDFERITLGAATPDLFRLPAYGIPDLPLRPQPRMSIFTFRNPVLWVALAATVVCFATLWVLRSHRVQKV